MIQYFLQSHIKWPHFTLNLSNLKLFRYKISYKTNLKLAFPHLQITSRYKYLNLKHQEMPSSTGWVPFCWTAPTHTYIQRHIRRYPYKRSQSQSVRLSVHQSDSLSHWLLAQLCLCLLQFIFIIIFANSLQLGKNLFINLYNFNFARMTMSADDGWADEQRCVVASESSSWL